MSHIIRTNYSAKQINHRLTRLLIRAFLIMMVVTLLVLLVGATFLITSVSKSNPFFTTPLSIILETFYYIKGDWQGINVFSNPDSHVDRLDLQTDWEQAILLDKDNRVIYDHGQNNTSLVGTIYQPRPAEITQQLKSRDQVIGMLVYDSSYISMPWRILPGFLGPLFILAVAMGGLTFITSQLLTHRVVAPLSEVIVAAQNVAGGDLSARVSVQGPDDLRVLSENFNQMASVLEKDEKERQNMLADIAHELRTPLSIIRGRLEGIMDGIYPADEAHIVSLLDETYMLERLVDDLRLLALAENRQLHFDLKTFDLVALVQRAVSIFTVEAEEHHISIDIENQVDVLEVTADRQRIEQVIGNLLNNAIRYTPEGGRITIQITRSAEKAGLSISDTGPGVPEEELPHIFDRFWRADKSRTRHSGGSGLGLAIARQLIEAQGGTMEAANLPERGLKVWFLI